MLDKQNLLEKFALFDDYWRPRIVAEMNGQWLKIAKAMGEMVWHSHDDEDELFWVLKGCLLLRLPDKTVTLHEGDIFVVPKATPHSPLAKEETWIALLEPKTTAHTGVLQHDQTVPIDEQVWI